MFAFFKRLFGIGKAHTLIEKQNDPTKMTAEEIKELRTALNDEIKKMNELKNTLIHINRKVKFDKMDSNDYERKAIAMLQHGQSGKMPDSEAERLAVEALLRSNELLKTYQENLSKKQQLDDMVSKSKEKIDELKSNINALEKVHTKQHWKPHYQNQNKILKDINSSETLIMLEKWKQKAKQKDDNLDIVEIDKSLIAPAILDKLNKLKEQIAMNNNNPQTDHTESKDNPDE
jgi:phage shock protein A